MLLIQKRRVNMTIEVQITRSACCGVEAEEISSTVVEPVFDRSDAYDIKSVVRSAYTEAAQKGAGCGCSSTTSNDAAVFMDNDYENIEGYVADADLGLGCGIPTDIAGIEAGHRVLDLGSGAGIDAFIARDLVGESGSVIGVDFTPAMVELARKNNQKLGFTNVEFYLGDIESLPLEDNVVDVIVSNCVLNLVPDKAKAFSEMARVLAPGGHFCISDVVSRGELPEDVRHSAEQYAGCVAGAIDLDKYVALLAEAGFKNIQIVKERVVRVPVAVECDGAIVSITVRGDAPPAYVSPA